MLTEKGKSELQRKAVTARFGTVEVFTEMEKIIERTRGGEGSLADLEDFEAIVIALEEDLNAFASATAPMFQSEIATARKGLKEVKKGIDQMKEQRA